MGSTTAASVPSRAARGGTGATAVWSLRLARVLLCAFVAGCCKDEPQPHLETRFDWREVPGALPPIGDQGESNTCAGWAVGYGATTFRLKRYAFTSWDLGAPANRASAAYLYNLVVQCEKEAEGGIGAVVVEDAELGPTVQVNKVIGFMVDHGIATEARMPFTVHYARHPTEEAMTEAAGLRSDMAWVGEWEAAVLDDHPAFRALLEERIRNVGPAIFEVRVYEDMDCGVGATYVVANRDFKGTHHALLCVGYDHEHHPGGQSAEAVPSVLLMNSWGLSWADKGFLWMSYKDLLEPASDGSLPILVACKLPTAPPADKPSLPELTSDFPTQWKENPYPPPVWDAETGNRCGAQPLAVAPRMSAETITLPPAERSIGIRGPRIPLVAGLLKSTVKFRLDPPPPAHAPYEIDAESHADRKGAKGAWVEVAELRVTDRLTAPNPITVVVTVERPNGTVYATKTVSVKVR